MGNDDFKVGDIVEWEEFEGEWTGPWTIEHQYNEKVFAIGNQHSFVNLVIANTLRKIRSE